MESDRRQGSPMRQRTIDFRQLVDRLLPLEPLPASDRRRVQRALETGISAQIEDAARVLLSRLETSGAVRRLTPDPDGRRVLRWQVRDSLDQIAIELPEAPQQEGMVEVPRPGLGAHAQAGLDQVRRLLRLDEAMLAADPRTGQARRALLEQLDQAGRELLGAAEVRFVSADEEETGTRAALPRPRDPGAAHARRPAPLPRHRALPGAGDRGTPPRHALGRRRRRHGQRRPAAGLARGARPRARALRSDALAMVALLADSCAGVLERAARIEKLVFIDPLTTVYNRAYFDLQLRNEMARASREHSSMALCIADIDDFKSFNTAFGYDAGDRVLVEVAQALRGGVRPFDTVARWGGEEFAVLLTPRSTPTTWWRSRSACARWWSGSASSSRASTASGTASA